MHDLGSYPDSYGTPSFESTPVLSGDTLYFSSPYDVVFALDARSGAERWHFDPKLGKLTRSGAQVTSRGVALWPLATTPDPKLPICSRRVFVATLDSRLFAVDASTGQPCIGFGDNGSVDLRPGVHFLNIGTYSVSSPPTIVGNVVVVGSAVLDNERVDIESGLVRGFDAVTGKLVWSWEPLPWAQNQTIRTGAGNTWSVISADPALGLVYLPTGAASLDFWGVLRPGDDRDANSVVALDAATGKKVWAFQTVHHDLWDYDIASEPVLFTWRGNTPAIAVTTKMGMIFLLDRRTGQPLVPVEERPVPQSDVPGERSSPTQPFQNIPTLSPLTLDSSNSSNYHQRSPADEEVCRKELSGLRYDGMYTPPSLQGSLEYPGTIGGVTWGGAAIDPTTGVLYADTNRMAVAIRLVPRHGLDQTLKKIQTGLDWLSEDIVVLFHTFVTLVLRRKISFVVFLLAVAIVWIGRRKAYPGWPLALLILACIAIFVWRHPFNDFYVRRGATPTAFGLGYYIQFSQHESPYVLEQQRPTDGHGFYCTPPPWGGIAAVNLNTLTKVWEKPLGTVVSGEHTGDVGFGGPIVTASGLVITAGSQLDPWLRVFDSSTGELLQQVALPTSATATPMTYTLDGRQYIVIAAGSHNDVVPPKGVLSPPLGDSLVAFAVN